MRRAAKVDLAQAEIVEGLRKAGYWVEVIGKPVDLAIGKFIMNGKAMAWAFMEVKTPTKAGKKPSKDKRQIAQNIFIDQTKTAVVTSLEQALEALRGL